MAEISQKIYIQNPWWENERQIEADQHLTELKKVRYIFLNNAFLDYPFDDGVYIVTGPRQIGKTTHLKLFIQKNINSNNKENFFYFNCDLLRTKIDIVDAVEFFLKLSSPTQRRYVILDEITSVKDSIIAVKYLVDSGQANNITYILTGSSTVGIKRTGEYLPGRRGKGKDIIFAPVNFSEYLAVQFPQDYQPYSSKFSNLDQYYYGAIFQKINLEQQLNQYLISGGIPRVINDYLSNKEISLDTFNLYRDWLASELAKNERSEQTAKIVLQRIARSIGNDVSYNSFVSDNGIGSHTTIYEYLNFLDYAFITKQIYNYDYRQKKVHFRKNKKIYFSDPFLYWLTLWWTEGNLADYKTIPVNPELKSKLIENLCFLRLNSLFKDIHFFREKNEIDFVGKKTAWECKYQNNIAPADLKELMKFDGKKFIITLNYEINFV